MWVKIVLLLALAFSLFSEETHSLAEPLPSVAAPEISVTHPQISDSVQSTAKTIQELPSSSIKISDPIQQIPMTVQSLPSTPEKVSDLDQSLPVAVQEPASSTPETANPVSPSPVAVQEQPQSPVKGPESVLSPPVAVQEPTSSAPEIANPISPNPVAVQEPSQSPVSVPEAVLSSPIAVQEPTSSALEIANPISPSPVAVQEPASSTPEIVSPVSASSVAVQELPSPSVKTPGSGQPIHKVPQASSRIKTSTPVSSRDVVSQTQSLHAGKAPNPVQPVSVPARASSPRTAKVSKPSQQSHRNNSKITKDKNRNSQSSLAASNGNKSYRTSNNRKAQTTPATARNNRNVSNSKKRPLQSSLATESSCTPQTKNQNSETYPACPVCCPPKISNKAPKSEVKIKKPKKKSLFPIPKRAILTHNMGYGEGSGSERGTDFTTFGVFLAPAYTPGSFYPLIDLRAHRFDNDSYALNVGIGGRYIPCTNNLCEILGINMFYDWRQGFLNEYNQLGVGIEVLGKRWDFRANGYFPVGQKKYHITCIYDEYEGDYVITEKKHEITTYGYNLEVGWLIVSSKYLLLYAAGGPYYLTRKSCCFEPIVGGKVRMRPQYKDYIALDVCYYRDSTSHSFWETTFIVSLPLYQVKNQNERPCRLSDRQIYQPIERLEIMTLGNRCCWTQNF